MLAYDDLLELDRRFRGTRVLSVYVPRAHTDPAQRRTSDVRIHTELSRIRHALASAPREEREAFEAAEALVSTELTTVVQGDGPFVAFATRDAMIFADHVHAPVTFHVHWGDGILVAPYVRSLKQHRPVLVLAIDSRSARLYRYQHGDVVALGQFEADVRSEPAMHMGDSARRGFHQGVRGATGRDETERREAAAFERMIDAIVDRIEPERSADPWLLVGGMPGSVHGMLRALPHRLVDRSTTVSALTPATDPGDVGRIASVAASELTARRDATLVDELAGDGAASIKSALGHVAVQQALDERSVHVLFVSATFVDQQLLEAEAMVRAALDGGSRVEVVTGVGAARLDDEWEGVAAELRFPPVAGARDRAAPALSVKG
ncbi:MAG: hypothetical protein U0163_15245 [Gemmatimonadaceae bacterium]